MKDGNWPYHATSQKGRICTLGTPERGDREITTATNNSPPEHGGNIRMVPQLGTRA